MNRIITMIIGVALGTSVFTAAQGADKGDTMKGSYRIAAGTQATTTAKDVKNILPSGIHTYTFYPSANVYYAPSTGMYYYIQSGSWIGSALPPAGEALGTGQTVQVRGTR